MGDDDSGPEDHEDDEDLECAKTKNDKFIFSFCLLRAYLIENLVIFFFQGAYATKKM